MSQESPEHQLSESFELSRKFQELKESLEKDYIDIKIPSSTSPIFGSLELNDRIPKTEKILKTETEDRNSLGDYLMINKQETLSKRNEDICELEKSRLEMRLTTLLEKEREIFNKTKDMDDIRRNEDKTNTKREMKNAEDLYLKNSKFEKNKRFDSMTYEEFKEKENEMMEIIIKLNERCEENDNLINNLAKEKVGLYEDLLEERKRTEHLSDKLEYSMKEFNERLIQTNAEKKEREEQLFHNLKKIKEELEVEKSKTRKIEKEMVENDKEKSFKKEKIEKDIKDLKEELSFIKNLKDVISQTNDYQKTIPNVQNISYENYNILKEQNQKLKKKQKKLKEENLQENKKNMILIKENEKLLKKIEELERLQTEHEEMNNLNDLRENIHELNIKLNELAKDNFDLHEKNEILHFQIKNMRDKENLRPHDELIEDKISFISNKNEKLILENNKLNNKVSLLSGHYFELIKNFKKKIFDFNRFAMQETHTFQIYKENVQNDLKTYIEKEKKIYLQKIKSFKQDINNKDNYIRILEKSKKIL